MEALEKVSKLEEQLGIFEEWNEDSLQTILEDADLFKFFDLSSVRLLTQRKNDDIESMLETIAVGYALTDSNSKFKAIFSTEDNDKNVELSKLQKSDELFDRINSTLLLLSDNSKPTLVLTEEQIKSDISEIQQIIIKLDISEGFSIINSLLSVMFKIQEFYFERNNVDLISELPDELKYKCEILEELMMTAANDVENLNEEDCHHEEKCNGNCSCDGNCGDECKCKK